MNSSSVFQKNWSFYRKIIESNYMYHQEIIKYLDKCLNNNYFDKILELGVGDASIWNSLNLSKRCKHFTGVDLSSEVLNIAHQNLLNSQIEFSLIESDIHTFMDKLLEKYSLIISNYTIHHLKDSQKEEIFFRIYECLELDGKFFYTDVLKSPPFQTKAQYCQEYNKLIKHQWVNLTDEEIELVINHIQEFDFPMEQIYFMDYLRSIGFKVESYPLDNQFHFSFILTKSI